MSEVPIGTIMPFAGDITTHGNSELSTTLKSQGWLYCDGSAYNRNDYADLYNVIQTCYGAEPSGEFCVPDLRGLFIRAMDDGRNIDKEVAAREESRYDSLDLTNRGSSGTAVGSRQESAYQSHSHQTGCDPADYHGFGSSDGGAPVQCAAFVANYAGVAAGGSETRPANIGLCYIIKAKDVSS